MADPHARPCREAESKTTGWGHGIDRHGTAGTTGGRTPQPSPDERATRSHAAKLTPFTGYDENGVWVSAYKDEYGNIVGANQAVDWQEPDRSYCCRFIATAEPGSVCAEITDGHRCGLPFGHDGACECDCGRVSGICPKCNKPYDATDPNCTDPDECPVTHATPDRVATPIWVVTANCGDYYCEGNHVLAVCTSPEMAAQKVEEAKQAKHVYIRRTGKRDDYNAWSEIEVEERVLDEVVKGTLTDQRAR